MRLGNAAPLKEMSFLFGGERAAPVRNRARQVEDLTRECRRTLNRGVRSLELEGKKLKAAEEADLKAVRTAAARGDTAGIKIAAKQLIRTRARERRNRTMQGRMVAMDRRLSDISSSSTLTTAMTSMTGLMTRMAKSTDLSAMANIIREFDRQNGAMDEKTEMIDDAIDGMDEEEGEGDDINDAISQVLMEIGLDTDALLARPPVRRPDLSETLMQAPDPSEAAFEGRLNRLRQQ